jgi:hypothetical protein
MLGVSFLTLAVAVPIVFLLRLVIVDGPEEVRATLRYARALWVAAGEQFLAKPALPLHFVRPNSGDAHVPGP